jgi:hypothetical protein
VTTSLLFFVGRAINKDKKQHARNSSNKDSRTATTKSILQVLSVTNIFFSWLCDL